MKRAAVFAIALLAGCSTAAAISADIAAACSDALPVVNAAAPFVAGSPIATTAAASVQAACTTNGMVQMTLNDQAPVTPTNSGKSSVWVAATKAFVQSAAATQLLGIGPAAAVKP